jgi:HK97 family phage portal protein
VAEKSRGGWLGTLGEAWSERRLFARVPGKRAAGHAEMEGAAEYDSWTAAARKAASSVSSGLTPTSPELMRFFGGSGSAGKIVTEESVLGLSTGWSCQRILTESIATLPVGVYERDRNGNAQKTTDHPVADLLASPNDEQTITEFLEQMVLGVVNGNGYAFTERSASGEVVTSIKPLPGSLVQPMRKRGANTRLAIPEGQPFYRVNDRGQSEDLPREKIWHVKLFTRDGLNGLSPIGFMRESAGFDMAAAEFGGLFFAQGGKPAGYVSAELQLTEDQRKIAREGLQMMLGGLGNAHRFALFENGLKPEPWAAMPLKDMEYVLLRKFGVQEMCRFYRVPPHMVADLDRATFTNIEHQGQEFVTYTLMPYFTRIEASALKWLFKPRDRARYFLRFNADALLRGDTAARGEYYAKLLQNGVLSRNEVRAKENWNRVEGLDGYTVQMQMVPVDRMDEMVDAQIEKATPAPAPAMSTADPARAPQDPKAAPAREEPSVTIQMPEILGKDMAYIVKHPAILAMLDEVKRTKEALVRSESRTATHIETRIAGMKDELKTAHEASLESLRAEVARLARIAGMPKKAVFDARGEIIGSVPVESLDELTQQSGTTQH